MKLFSRGDALRSPEFHKKKQREQTIKIIAVVVFIVVFIATPIYLFRLNRFLISNIELEGNTVTSYEDVATIVADDMNGNYLFIFPKSNALIYPKNKIKDDLIRNIPRIKDIKISLINPKSIKINITEREPAGLYCANSQNLEENCYYLDSNGFIYSKAPSFSGDVYFIYSSEPKLEDPLGKNYLKEEEFKSLPVFINSLKEIHIPLRSLTTTDNELYLELIYGGKIIINRRDDLKTVASNIDSFLNDQNITKTPEFFQNVSYIDMRFGNKVFYKLKSEI